MKKTLIQYTFIIFLWSSVSAAELPFALTNDTTGGYNATDKAVYAENETVIEKEFDQLKNFTFAIDNIVSYEDPDVADELGFGVTYALFDFLTIGVKPQLFFGEEFSTGATGTIGLEYAIEGIGLSFEDTNDFAYNFTESAFEYVNTFGIEKSITSFGDWGLAIGIENEIVVPDGDVEDLLSVGPSVSNDTLSFSAAYVVGIAPEVSHAFEAGVGLSF